MSETEWTPATANELSRIVSENAQNGKRPFTPVGGRTSLSLGNRLPDETVLLSTSELNQILDYPARDMTVTVEAGIRIEVLQKELAKENQRLPIDIAQAGRATLGGAIATNTSGPGRFGYGTFRDYVIGITAVDGRGRTFSAGGRVVKNVAGYDLCKLLVGSLGSLAVITSVTLKLRPVSDERTLVMAAVQPGQAEPILVQLNRSKTRPFAAELLNAKATWQLQAETGQALVEGTDSLWLGFEGSFREVEWQEQTAIEELKKHSLTEVTQFKSEQSNKLYQALVEFQTASDDPLTFQASVPASRCAEFLSRCDDQKIAAQAHAGNGVIIGHLADTCTNAQQANAIISPLQDFAARHSGALTILNCDPTWKNELNLFGMRNSSWKLMEGIKKKLDPENLLSPNRLI